MCGRPAYDRSQIDSGQKAASGATSSEHEPALSGIARDLPFPYRAYLRYRIATTLVGLALYGPSGLESIPEAGR